MVRKSLPGRSRDDTGGAAVGQRLHRAWQALRRQGTAAWLVEVPLLAAIVSAVVLAGTSWSTLW